jgi:DNA invertase Pin-like site-specific DNA recombinase
VYTRISSDREDLQLGVARQEADCRRLCTERGWQITEVYCDNDISAADPRRRRPEYERMATDMRRKAFDVIVVAATDRLWRQPLEQEQLIADCLEVGMTQVSTPRRDYRLDTDDVDMLRVEGVFAAGEANRIRRRVKGKHLELAQSGEYHGGSRPFGYGRNPVDGSPEDKAAALATRNDLNPVEAELIREAATRILRGESLHSVRRDWQERGVKTTTGKTTWSVSTLKRVLTSPRVAGLRQHQGEILEGVETSWQPILDRETWEQVRVVLTDPKRFTGPRTQSYPLAGILTCALCGEPLKAMPRQGRRCYGCKKETGGCGRIHVRSEAIEDFIFGVILPVADSPELRDALQADEEGGAEAARELVLANAEDEKMLNRLSDDYYTDRIIDRSRYLKQYQKLRERIEGRESQLTTIRGTTLGCIGGEVQSSWDSMSAEDKRSIIKSLINEIEVNKAPTPGSNRFDPDRVNIFFRLAIIAKLAHVDSERLHPSSPAFEELARL